LADFSIVSRQQLGDKKLLDMIGSLLASHSLGLFQFSLLLPKEEPVKTSAW
jgi:hypothetical protein